MCRVDEVKKEFALDFLGELELLESHYREGIGSVEAFADPITGDWLQVSALMEWAIDRRDDDPFCLQLSCDFLEKAPNVLDAVELPEARIGRLEKGRGSAKLLRRRESEIAHLGNLVLAYRNSGRFKAIVSLLQELLELASGKDALEEANILTLLGEGYRSALTPRYEEAKQVLERALLISNGKPYPLKALTYHNLGIVAKNTGNLSESIDYHSKEATTATAQDQTTELVRANVSLGMAHFELVEVDQALEYYNVALDITKQPDFENSAESAYMYVVDNTPPTAKLVYGVGTKRWQDFNRLPLIGNRGIALSLLGRYQEALDAFQQAIEISQNVYQTRYEAVWNYQKAKVYYFLGEYETALNHYEHSLLKAIDAGASRAEGFALFGLGRAKIAKSYEAGQDLKEGTRHIEQAFELANDIGNKRDIQEWGAGLAEAYIYGDRPDRAQEIIQEILSIQVVENKYLVSTLSAFIETRLGMPNTTVEKSVGCAIALSSAILRKCPGHVIARYTLGLALSILGVISSPENRAERFERARQEFFAVHQVCSAKGHVDETLRFLDQLHPLGRNEWFGSVRTLFTQ